MLQRRKVRLECQYGCCKVPVSKGTLRAREARLWKKEN